MEKQTIVDNVIKQLQHAEKNCAYDAINQKLIKKRVGWYKTHKHKLNLEGSDVRKAYTLLFLKLDVDFKKVPIAHETETKITWKSYNWCPVLEACKILNLDTRKVCKLGWEDSVNALIQQLNPKLRFSRKYKALRPYGEYCEETIELIN